MRTSIVSGSRSALTMCRPEVGRTGGVGVHDAARHEQARHARHHSEKRSRPATHDVGTLRGGVVGVAEQLTQVGGEVVGRACRDGHVSTSWPVLVDGEQVARVGDLDLDPSGFVDTW